MGDWLPSRLLCILLMTPEPDGATKPRTPLWLTVQSLVGYYPLKTGDDTRMREGRRPPFYLLIVAGILASAFFSLTFIINQSLSLADASWQWTAALRYFFMVPLLGALLRITGKGEPTRITRVVGQNPTPWIIGGTIGFGFFYAPLTFAAAYGPAWLVAGTWQLTILIGGLLEPWLRKNTEHRTAIPWQTLLVSSVILLGIGLLQWSHVAQTRNWARVLPLVIPLVFAATAYPVGNRWMLAHRASSLGTVARTYGMTLGSLPFWIAIAVWGYLRSGWPTTNQLVQSMLVALSSGVVATLLFYWATEKAYAKPDQLAAVEATQSAEVVFAAIGAILILGQPWPSPIALTGMGCIVIGLIWHSLSSHTNPRAASAQNEDSA